MEQYLMKKLEILLLGINYCPSLKLRLDLAAPKLCQKFRKQEGMLWTLRFNRSPPYSFFVFGLWVNHSKIILIWFFLFMFHPWWNETCHWTLCHTFINVYLTPLLLIPLMMILWVILNHTFVANWHSWQDPRWELVTPCCSGFSRKNASLFLQNLQGLRAI